MNSRTPDAPVGQVIVRAQDPTTRRGTPRQERPPSALWPTATAVTAASSQGHHPAHPRLAISTREHQTGGAPTRSASTRRGHLTRAPPTGPATEHSPPRRSIIRSWVSTSRTPPASLSRSTTSILDPTTHPRSWRRSREQAELRSRRFQPRSENGQTIAMPYSHLTGPFHIRSTPGVA